MRSDGARDERPHHARWISARSRFACFAGSVATAAYGCRYGAMTETLAVEEMRDYSGIATPGSGIPQHPNLHTRATWGQSVSYAALGYENASSDVQALFAFAESVDRASAVHRGSVAPPVLRHAPHGRGGGRPALQSARVHRLPQELRGQPAEPRGRRPRRRGPRGDEHGEHPGVARGTARPDRLLCHHQARGQPSHRARSRSTGTTTPRPASSIRSPSSAGPCSTTTPSVTAQSTPCRRSPSTRTWRAASIRSRA